MTPILTPAPGLKLAGGPWYVSRKDTKWNVLYVRRSSEINLNPCAFDSFLCVDVNWFDGPPSTSKLQCKV